MKHDIFCVEKGGRRIGTSRRFVEDFVNFKDMKGGKSAYKNALIGC